MQLDVFLSFDFAQAVEDGTCPHEIILRLSEITTDNAEAIVNKLTNLHPSIPIIGINLYNASKFQIKYFFDGLKNNSNIRHLLITHYQAEVGLPLSNMIGPVAPISPDLIQDIVNELANSSFLKCIHMTQVPMNDPDTFFAFLLRNRIITHLYIKDFVDEEIIKSAFKAVKNRESIIYLTLHDGNDFEMELTSEMIQSLAVENGFNRSLHGLNLIGIYIDYEELNELTKVLGRYSNIEVLTIQSSMLDSKGMKAIVNLLKTNSSLSSLRSLDINTNRIGNEGLQLLGDALRTNTTLRSLNLVATGLHRTKKIIQPDGQIARVSVENIEDGWKYLLSCLQKNTSLTNIVVGSDSDGVEDFPCWSEIEKILMNNHERLADSVTELTEEDTYFDTTESVELNSDRIGSSWPMIVKLLQNMPALKKLSINANDLHNDYTKSVGRNEQVEKAISTFFVKKANTTFTVSEVNSNKQIKLG